MDRSGFLEWLVCGGNELALFAFFYLIDSEVPVFGGTMGGGAVPSEQTWGICQLLLAIVSTPINALPCPSPGFLGWGFYL